MIILTSSGLITQNNIKSVRKYILKNYKRAAIVTTASEFKSNNKHIPAIEEWIEKLELESECFDFDTDDIKKLEEFDVMILIGGNPFYLLKSIKDNNYEEIIKDFGMNKLLIGISAGSIVLGQNMDLIYEFNPEYNDNVGLSSFKGLGLTIDICPHYDRFDEKYENFEERIQKVERLIGQNIYRLKEEVIYSHIIKRPSLLERSVMIAIFSMMGLGLLIDIAIEIIKVNTDWITDTLANQIMRIAGEVAFSGFALGLFAAVAYGISKYVRRKKFKD